jgi:hypothetical protein
MGLLISCVPVMVLLTQGHQRAEWPASASFLLVGIGIFGLAIGCIGIFGDKRTTERWARHADNGAHVEVTIFVAVIAAPLFCLLKLLKRK